VTDVLLRQSNDGGEITLEGGLFAMSDGLEAAVYLSLYGSNESDPGGSDLTEQYWANIGESIPSRTYRSETQYLIRSLPAVPNSLRRIEQAVTRDLAWMITEGIAKSIGVNASIPAINRVVIDLVIITEHDQIQLSFG
jgi:phage gp46-like protein